MAVKRSISFDVSILAGVEWLSAERGVSLSAFVNEAVERYLKVEGGRRLMKADSKRFDPIEHSHP